MKKLVYLSTAALLALAACTKDNVLEKEEAPGIDFSTLSSNSLAKSDVVTSDNFETNTRTFYVIGDYSDASSTTPYMANTIEHTSSGWGYKNATHRHWPADNKPLDFYAVSPSSYIQGSATTATEASTAFSLKKDNNTTPTKYDGATLTDFTVATDVKNQIDLMFASAKSQIYSNTNSGTKGQVKLDFQHALSQIKFAAKATEVGGEKISVTIYSISLCKVPSKGTVTYTGAFDWNVPDDNKVIYEVKAVADNNGKYPTITSDDNNTDEKAVNISSSGLDVDASEKYVIGGEKDTELLLIPQELKAWTTTLPVATASTATQEEVFTMEKADAAYLKISCDLSINDDLLVKHNDNTGGLTDVYIPFNTQSVISGQDEWEPSKIYTYILNFQGGGYDIYGNEIHRPITFSVAISNDWAVANNGGIGLN